MSNKLVTALLVLILVMLCVGVGLVVRPKDDELTQRVARLEQALASERAERLTALEGGLTAERDARKTEAEKLDAVFRQRKPGEERELEVADAVWMRFCWIPLGKATLGSPATEVSREDDENEHPFEEKMGFWLGKYPVTQVQWTAVMGGDLTFYFHKNGRSADSVKGLATENFPAENVSFDNIYGPDWKEGDKPREASFLAKFTERVNPARAKAVFGSEGEFRLPTGDEWEYACRGGRGNKSPFYWGKSLNGDQANCNGREPYGTTDRAGYLGRVTNVGAYQLIVPHPWGLCDMAGNVRQWCESRFDAGLRTLRGGGWADAASACRTAHQHVLLPDHRDSHTGFRICFRPN